MGRPPWASTLFTVAALLVTVEARAQTAVEWDISGNATFGFTDNANGAPIPEDDAPEGTGPEPDGFFTITPAFRLQMERADSTHTLTYGVGYTLYFLHPELGAFSQALSYGMRAPVQEGVDLTFAVTGSQSTTSLLSLTGGAAGGQVQATTGGNDMIITAGVGQGITAEVGPTWTFFQAFAGAHAHSITEDNEDGYTQTASLTLGANKEYKRELFGITQSNDVQWSPFQEGVRPDDSLQLVHRIVGDWTHQFSLDWATQLHVGGLYAYDVVALQAGDPLPYPDPIGGANVRWTPVGGNMSLSYARDATPNLILRQVTLNDTGTHTGSVELPKGLDFGGSAAVQVTRAFSDGEDEVSPGLSVLLDAALGYVPRAVFMRIEGRYQYNRQFALGDVAVIPELQRHTVMLTTAFAYPRPPEPGGVGRGVALPSPTANVDIVSRQAPQSARAREEERLESKDPQERKEQELPPERD
ncbi:MAG: hypothetical protein IPM79_14800 [Polyangiaceae bacterium]|nr:hypothetical protein [Polyangiaceae bacterium]